MRQTIPLAICALSILLSACAHAGESPQRVLVHYMPWYSSESVSGQWGWHWTMNHFDPDSVHDDGRREVASHYYPLIGPYDSGDPHALECHVLLMKYAGIDGVVVDWYGIEPFRDYGVIHRNTERLLMHAKKAGLVFAVCYEDQTIAHLVEGGVLEKSGDIAHGTSVMSWLDAHWFHDEAYLEIDARPVLLVFGPQYFQKEQWAKIMSRLPTRPLLYALPHLSRAAGADGAFGWPPVHGGKEIAPAVWREYLRDLYSRGERGESVIAAVFPQYHDVYKEAGLHDSYGSIDGRDGRTFEETLDLAWKSSAPLIQIATWNDYGEGTMIEPSAGFGYRYLEALQDCARARLGKTFPFVAADLRLPVELYELRKKLAGDPAAARDLDRASVLLFASRCAEARAVLNARAIRRRADTPERR